MHTHRLNCPVTAPSAVSNRRVTPRQPSPPCQCHSHRQIRGAQTLRAAQVAETSVESPEAEAVLPSPAANDQAQPEPASEPVSSVRQARQTPYFVTSFLWLEKTVAVCVDQVFSEGQRSPLTEYFMWPHGDAWEKLKAALDSKPWIKEADKNELLNSTTAVIEYWQDEPKHSIDTARSQFPDFFFQGY